MKIFNMIAVLLSLIFIFLSSYTAEAYTYSSYMEIESLPENKNEEDSICYNDEKVYDNGNILSIPPDTKVVFGVEGDFENGTMADIYTFLSKDNIYQGDLTKFFDDSSFIYSNLFFVKNYADYQRYGKMRVMEDVVLSNGRNDLFSLTMKQLLEVLEYTYTIEDGIVEVKTTVKNDTEMDLYDVVYTHGDFSKKRDFVMGEQYTYEYILEYDKEDQYTDLGYPSIYNPNTRTQCAAGINSPGNHHNIFLTEDGIYIYPDRGTQEDEDFCITQIRYTLNLGKIEIGEKEESNTDDNSNEKTDGSSEEDIGEILGIDILPKTAVDMYGYIFLGIFLVAFGILCYYFTNEDSIRNA